MTMRASTALLLLAVIVGFALVGIHYLTEAALASAQGASLSPAASSPTGSEAPSQGAPATPLRLVVPAESQSRMGLHWIVAPGARFATTASGYARVLDPSPLALLITDLDAASATAAASGAEARRARTLLADDQIVSARVAEAATAQATADLARVSLLRTRLGLEWGGWLASMGDLQRRGLLSGLARGDIALVQITGAAASLDNLTVSLDLGDGGRASARVLGPARLGDARQTGPAWIAIVHGANAKRLGVGQVVSVILPTDAEMDGVQLPDGAVLRAEGSDWAYVRTATGFERRRLDGVSTSGDGVFVRGGVQRGETVVTQGASALYTAERAGG